MMKTELNLLVACSMLITACGSLKSNKTLHTQEFQSNSYNEENTNQQSWATKNTVLLDTSNSEYVVQITPLGKFFYSTEKGFEGMAEKVVVRGKAGRKQILHQQQQTGHQLQQQKHSLESTQLATRVQRIDKSRRPASAVWWIGLAVALGLVYWLIRKWRFA
ncbi:hypothetical protein [Pedobacter alluvionis]|uniref:Lipoprotein n=1 Tax=Pedobacter alluvionis TaxID=475253 RepID=A0A497XLL7_9SPHI|nr:hypothetical protein [Pedobacter alluvionis]RLJ69590.1 hypothetical protein BCL90_5188 [Pedobacter alluvionis]TFB28349.1 hypothetical protein E3V97_22970 [Pedobacter alluvionis]